MKDASSFRTRKSSFYDKKSNLPQMLFDHMFHDFDSSLREMGFGDVSVNKKMKGNDGNMWIINETKKPRTKSRVHLRNMWYLSLARPTRLEIVFI